MPYGAIIKVELLGADVVAVGQTLDGVIHVWVRGDGPNIPNPWMGYPTEIHQNATHDKFGIIS